MVENLLLEGSATSFDAAVNGLIADGENNRLLDLFQSLPDTVAQLRASPEDRFDVGVAITNAAAATAIALRRGKRGVLDIALESLFATYRLGDVDSDTGSEEDLRLWEEVAAGLWALGAVAVALEDWPAIRSIVARPPDEEGKHYDTWLRHVQVQSARGAAVPTDDNVLNFCAQRLAVVPSFGQSGAPQAERDRLVCAFDQLALLVTQSLPDSGALSFYPSYAKHPVAYVEPLVIELRRAGDMRATIFPGDDSELREVLREANELALLQAAQSRYLGRPWKYEGFQDARTWTFIRAGHILEGWGMPAQPVPAVEGEEA